MGFTIEDMLLVARGRYDMDLIAGQEGWSNSISWLLMLEDRTIIRNFSGKEVAVTTGLGFQTEEQLMELIRDLCAHHCSGLIVNTGFYIRELPQAALDYCDSNGFPLMTVPWDVFLADMIKDISTRVFLQTAADEQISASLIHALEHPQERERYVRDLLPYFDVDGTFQVFLLTTATLDRMDTVERRRIGYRMQLYLTNITHNSHFFYYDGCFVMVLNALTPEFTRRLLTDFLRRISHRMPELPIHIGVGSHLMDISRLSLSYQRAKAAVTHACRNHLPLVSFDEMGPLRLLYAVSDRPLLQEMGEDLLSPLLAHDKKHHSDYVGTLEAYLRHDGSIQETAEALFAHRNTVTYRIRSIKKLLGCDLVTAEEKMKYYVACLIRQVV